MITTNFDCKYNKDKEGKFAITHIIGTTKQQQLVHINIPFKKIHTEEPILYNCSTLIVRDGIGTLYIGDNSIMIKPNDIIMVEEHKGFRLWSSHSELNVYIIYSTQVYPDRRKGDHRKRSLNVITTNTHPDDVDTTCGIFSNCSK